MKKFALALAIILAFSVSALASVTPTFTLSGDITVGFDYLLKDTTALKDDDGNWTDGSASHSHVVTVAATPEIGHWAWLQDPITLVFGPVWVVDHAAVAAHDVTVIDNAAPVLNGDSVDTLGFAWDEKPKVSYDLQLGAKSDNYEFSIGAISSGTVADLTLRDAFFKHAVPVIGGTLKAGQDWTKTSSGSETKTGVWYDNTWGALKVGYFHKFSPNEWKLDGTFDLGGGSSVGATVEEKVSYQDITVTGTMAFSEASKLVAKYFQAGNPALESKSGSYVSGTLTAPVGPLAFEGYLKYWSADFNYMDKYDNASPWGSGDDYYDGGVDVDAGVDNGASYVKGTFKVTDVTSFYGKYFLDADWEVGGETVLSALKVTGKYGEYTDDDPTNELTYGAVYNSWKVTAGTTIGAIGLDGSISATTDWTEKVSTSLTATYKISNVTYTAAYAASTDNNPFSENDTTLSVTAKISF